MLKTRHIQENWHSHHHRIHGQLYPQRGFAIAIGVCSHAWRIKHKPIDQEDYWEKDEIFKGVEEHR